MNLPASAPDKLQVTVSFAVNECTVVVFSAIEALEVEPVLEPGPVIIGTVVSITIALFAAKDPACPGVARVNTAFCP